MTEPTGWHDNVRDDGTRIEAAGIGQYMAIGPKAAWTLRACPCCDKPFATPRNAMLTADALFPLDGKPDPRWVSIQLLKGLS
jgi:hypothetical protein